MDAERRLGFGQLDVRPPQFLRAPVQHIAAQHVAAFTELRPATPAFPLGPRHAQPRRLLGHPHLEQPRRPAVLAQQPPDLPLHRAAIRLLRPLQPRRQMPQPFLNAPLKAFVHRRLFVPPRATAAQDEGLLAVRPRAVLHLQVLTDRLPRACDQFALKTLERALGRAHDVAPAAAPQELDLLR